MIRFNKSITVIYFSLLSFVSKTQVIDPTFLHNQWNAKWITVPQINPTAYGVYYFRKNVELSSVAASFPIFVSADNRYKLFVNEKLVSLGPARGDVAHWNFERVDIAPFLRSGKNTVAAQVWNEGELRPEAQISLRTAFILQGGTSNAQILNTDDTWKCMQDSSYRPIRIVLPTYYVSGPGELIHMQAHIKNWAQPSFNDHSWRKAEALFTGTPKNMMGAYGTLNGWLLVPSSLPQMELKEQRLPQVRRVEAITVPAAFPATKTAITIPANTNATLLLDQTFLTNAYPTVVFSDGRNASISISYQEALYTKFPEKGNRNDIEGKYMMGRKDSIISDGSPNQRFTSLNWRTYRYLQLHISTKESPLVLEDIYGTFTAYPFQFNAKLETDHTELQKMLEIGWRTARLCAVETYMDCPYYEQLQYVGDTRIQGLISIYNSGDERLLRNALNQIDYSRQPEGVTLSRYPSVTHQYIPPFSLWYIGMLHDYMMYGSDSGFLKGKLPGARQILAYFKEFQQADGSLKNVPHWTFTDWVTTKGWQQGMAPVGKDGNSALLDLQLLWAYQLAADMEQQFGMKEYATLYKQYAAQLMNTIRNKYWHPVRRLFADRAEKDLFSQHANALAMFTGLVSGPEMAAMGRQLVSDTTLAPASIYFKYYLHRALVLAGMGNDYLSWLSKWRENIDMGLTTWAEISEVSTARSDCHAWGSSPNIEFFRTILGVDTDAPNFRKVKIEPHLGSLENIAGEVPHPNGKIGVRYSHINGRLQAAIHLPVKTTGRFIWKGKSYTLKEGSNNITL